MSRFIGGIIDYEPEPEAAEVHKKTNLMWLFAALSLSMAAIGYLIILAKIF